MQTPDTEASTPVSGASEITYAYPTIVDAGQAFTVAVGKLTDARNNLPTFVKAGYVFAGYGLSQGMPGGLGDAGVCSIPTTFEECEAVLREQWNTHVGLTDGAAVDVSKIDWKKLDWLKIAAAIAQIVKLFTSQDQQ